MPHVTGDFGRDAKLAALTLPVLLAAAVATYRAAGAPAALALVASATIVVLFALLAAARRRARRALEHRQLGQRALDAVPQAVFVADERPGAPNILVNAAYAALTGYGAGEATADGFDARAIFVGGAGIPALADDADRGSARVVVRRRDGTTFPAKVDVRAVPRGKRGRYLVGTIEDVTFGERATDREAPTEVAAPGSEVRDDGRAAGLFFSWLCHELRSPLNACLMWLDVLALGPQPDKLPQAIEAIKRGLLRQAKLIGDLSDAAKVAAGGLEMRFERVDLVALIANAAGAWQLLAIGKPLKFQQRIELGAASVDGDAERLLSALNHLVENAINSTPPQGQVDVRVRGGRETCVVEVEDTGPALSADDAANLAAPLARWPMTAKARSGLGLGLAVAHHVAARHGGTLTAAAEGSRTRFVLTLPLASGTAAGHARPSGGDAAALGPQSSSSR